MIIWRKYAQVLQILAAMWLLGSCTLSSPTSAPAGELQAQAQEAASPTVTASLAPETPAPSPSETPIQTVTVAPEPLHFIFPSAAPPPISAWRPPLYPTPWVPTAFDHFYFGRPIGADQVNWPLADYRYGGVFFKDTVHSGVDIDAPKGTPVMAAGPGKVTWVGYGLNTGSENLRDPYGLAVSIRHDFGYLGDMLYTVYGHMDQVFVYKDQHVDGGDVIGLVGETGNVTGPHLHFEVRVGLNNAVRSYNPELWMSPPQGWGVLAARILDSNGSPVARQTIKIYATDSDRTWEVKTYGRTQIGINKDPYYQENMVIGDLPAGDYVVRVEFGQTAARTRVHIDGGQVSYFTFHPKDGFVVGPPPTPQAHFTPPVSTDTPTPTP